MKRQSLPWMLSMFLVSSAGSFGCDDGDTPATKGDASVTGGADGAAAGGTGGVKVDAAAGGGAGGAVGGAGGTDAGTDAAKGGAGGGGGAAGGAGGGAGGAVGGSDGGVDAAGGTAGTDAGTDAVSDMAPVDMAPDMTVNPPDAGSTVAVTQCAEIICPEYFAITGACDAHELNSCTKSVSGGVSTVCNGTPNGVVKRRVSGVDIIDDHVTTVQVVKADGSPCYTLELATKTGDPLERWTFKKPDGTTFATGGYTDSAVAPTNKFYLVCGNVRYNVMDGRSCAGFEGDTSNPMPPCMTGTCAIP